jgi:hypothetical protein
MELNYQLPICEQYKTLRIDDKLRINKLMTPINKSIKKTVKCAKYLKLLAISPTLLSLFICPIIIRWRVLHVIIFRGSFAVATSSCSMFYTFERMSTRK